MPSNDFIGSGRMAAGKAEHTAIVPGKQRFVVSNVVVLAEDAPHTVAVIWAAIVELVSHHTAELVDEGFIDNHRLTAVGSRRLVLTLANARHEELGHIKVRIAQQRRHTNHRRHYLPVKRAATVAHKQIGVLTVANVVYEIESLGRMQRKVGRNHLYTSGKSIAQGESHLALPRSEKPM